jgi:ribA/ribD-fused uncharacterized protein
VENFFHAMKTEDNTERRRISNLSPNDSKRAGRKLILRKDWDTARLGVMEFGLRHKFAPGTSWHTKLMETGEEEIVEWNNWGDRYWGKTEDGVGENHLGRLFMKLRQEYNSKLHRI